MTAEVKGFEYFFKTYILPVVFFLMALWFNTKLTSMSENIDTTNGILVELAARGQWMISMEHELVVINEKMKKGELTLEQAIVMINDITIRLDRLERPMRAG